MAWKGSIAAVAVTSDSAYTTVSTVAVQEGAESLWVEVVNSADAALTGFRAQYRAHADGNYNTVLTLASDWYGAAPRSPVIASSADPTTLAKSGTALFGLTVKGVNSVRLQAKVGTVSDTSLSGGWQQR